ncbi:UNVERIFIED_CONTAM: hypothetical protein GTU68_052334 [Idotea baltica]|nr:hypothetical protein [Idotea baltica]
MQLRASLRPCSRMNMPRVSKREILMTIYMRLATMIGSSKWWWNG